MRKQDFESLKRGMEQAVEYENKKTMKNDIRKPKPCKFVIPLCDIHISDNEKSVDVWLEPDYFSDKEVFKLFDWFMRLALIRLSNGNWRKRYDKKTK